MANLTKNIEKFIEAKFNSGYNNSQVKHLLEGTYIQRFGCTTYFRCTTKFSGCKRQMLDMAVGQSCETFNWYVFFSDLNFRVVA